MQLSSFPSKEKYLSDFIDDVYYFLTRKKKARNKPRLSLFARSMMPSSSSNIIVLHFLAETQNPNHVIRHPFRSAQNTEVHSRARLPPYST